MPLHYRLSNFFFSHDSYLMLYRKMHSSGYFVIRSTQSSWFQSPRGYQDPQMLKSYIKGLSILCNCGYHIPLFNQSQMESTGWNSECRTCLHLVPQKISSVIWDEKPMEAKVVHKNRIPHIFFLISCVGYIGLRSATGLKRTSFQLVPLESLGIKYRLGKFLRNDLFRRKGKSRLWGSRVAGKAVLNDGRKLMGGEQGVRTQDTGMRMEVPHQ